MVRVVWRAIAYARILGTSERERERARFPILPQLPPAAVAPTSSYLRLRAPCIVGWRSGRLAADER
jgi:hypothetical protein